jgi:hypothetical protein
VLLVDAANVVGSRPDGWWRDRAGAAARLVASLAALASYGVGHAPGSGDDTLAGLCGPDVLLVTADRGLRAHAEAAGATAHGPRWLLEQLTDG